MDRLDIALIREMSQQNPTLPARVGLRSSYRDMAKKLRVSPGTVKQRIAKMHSSGIVTGSSVYANPSLLGLKGGAYAMEVSPLLRKRDVMEKLKLIDGILFIHNFHGNLVGIAFLYEDEGSLKKTIDQFLRAAGAKGGILSHVQYPPCDVSLASAEWNLVARLSRGSFESYAELAGELKTSIRTLKRRLSKIAAARAIVSVPTLDYRAIDGAVPADLIVMFGDKETKEETEKQILHLVDDFLVFAGIGQDFVVYNLVLPKMMMASALADKIMAIGGVKMARAELVDEHIDLTNRLENYVQKHLKVKN